MTPYQKLGYTAQTVFKFIGDDGEFNKGEIVWLLNAHDDGSGCPMFTNGITAEYLYLPEQEMYAADVKPIFSKEQVTDTPTSPPLLAVGTAVKIDLSKEGSEKTVDPLVSITQQVNYYIKIKGTEFKFSQEELDTLAEELLRFTTL